MPNDEPTQVDEHLLTAAKLREQINGNIDTTESLHQHIGLIPDEKTRSALSFVESAVVPELTADRLADTKLGALLHASHMTDAATDALHNGNSEVLSHIVGVTEQELDASSLTATARLLDRLDADGTLTTVLAAGRPNTGKTNTVFLLCDDMARTLWDDLLVISNAGSWTGADVVTHSMFGLMKILVDNQHRPKVIVLDEMSRYMDARTYSHEVSSQFTPAQKAMSKLGVEVCACIGHSGKDVVPEIKRMTNLALWKTAPKKAEFYRAWHGDSDRPRDPLFDADLSDLEPTATEYDPDDVASWTWDLDPDVWDDFDSWDEFGNTLNDIGPVN